MTTIETISSTDFFALTDMLAMEALAAIEQGEGRVGDEAYVRRRCEETVAGVTYAISFQTFLEGVMSFASHRLQDMEWLNQASEYGGYREGYKLELKLVTIAGDTALYLMPEQE